MAVLSGPYYAPRFFYDRPLSRGWQPYRTSGPELSELIDNDLGQHQSKAQQMRELRNSIARNPTRKEVRTKWRK